MNPLVSSGHLRNEKERKTSGTVTGDRRGGGGGWGRKRTISCPAHPHLVAIPGKNSGTHFAPVPSRFFNGEFRRVVPREPALFSRSSQRPSVREVGSSIPTYGFNRGEALPYLA